jgi:Holliday junction resolvase RusA-like endonuclease
MTEKQKMRFFISLEKVPTSTGQEKKISFRGKRPVIYDSEKSAAARELLEAELSHRRPERKFRGPIMLSVSWDFPTSDRKKVGTYKVTKPDTDNLEKLLKDSMTGTGFWEDDAQVAVEIITKRWVPLHMGGIYIEVAEIDQAYDLEKEDKHDD